MDSLKWVTRRERNEIWLPPPHMYASALSRHFPTLDLPPLATSLPEESKTLSKLNLKNRQRCMVMWYVTHVNRSSCPFFDDYFPTVDLCSAVVDVFEHIILNPFSPSPHHPFQRIAPQGHCTPSGIPPVFSLTPLYRIMARTGTCSTSTASSVQSVLP
jgi:hypothetical protein